MRKAHEKCLLGLIICGLTDYGNQGPLVNEKGKCLSSRR